MCSLDCMTIITLLSSTISLLIHQLAFPLSSSSSSSIQPRLPPPPSPAPLLQTVHLAHPVARGHGNGLNSFADPHLICQQDPAFPLKGKMHPSTLEGHQSSAQVWRHAAKSLFCFCLTGALAAAPARGYTHGRVSLSTMDLFLGKTSICLYATELQLQRTAEEWPGSNAKHKACMLTSCSMGLVPMIQVSA